MASIFGRFRRTPEPVRPSIYEHVQKHIPDRGPGLTDGGETLPDEGDVEGPVRWMAGAHDGVATHHMGYESADKEADEVARLVSRAVRGGDREFRALEHRLLSIEPLPIVDALSERLIAAGLIGERLASVAERLVKTSGSRNVVKVGIAILGISTSQTSRQVLMSIGRHDEFTLFSAVALANSEPQPEDAVQALWELGQLVDGWGRIHTVERLRNTARPDIKDWILRKGFRNAVMDGYLAFIAATTGGLFPALQSDDPDDEVLVAACDILSALIEGGPSEDIDDFAEAPQALVLLMGHLKRRANTVHHLLAVDDIARFVAADDDRWAERESSRWPAGLRMELAATCAEIEGRPDWADLAIAGFDAEGEFEFHEAQRASRIIGIDVLDAHLRRIAKDPLSHSWGAVMDLVDAGRLRGVLRLAEQSLPLSEIATGAAEEYGLGPAFRPHMALAFVVQGLARFPGKGWQLLAAALRSPAMNNRNAALNTLESWDRVVWPPEAEPALREAAAVEPNEAIRDRMSGLLK